MAQEEVEFSEDLFESMLDGTFEEKEPEEVEEDIDDSEDVEDEADAADNFDEDNDEHQEDTDQEEESEDDSETNDESDGDYQDTEEDEEDDEEEDTLVESDDSDDESEADEASDEVSEDDAETEAPSDGEEPATEEVDYKAFYDAVTNAEFVVNGKKVKGFKDPQKIIQSQQMAGGFSEKMAGFKQYRPFMSPLKERGMLDDASKFDLAMNLIDGDKEAIKTHLKTLGIDPLDLDMDTIDYTPTAATASQESLVIEDVMERAKSAGVEDRVRQVVGKEWDADSFQEFVTNPAVRDDLLNHIETGAYDKVQEKILEMKRLDFNGSYSAKKTIDQYREAVQALQREYVPPKETAATVAPKAVKSAPKASVKSEKAKIEKARKEAEYKAKAAEQESKRMNQRKRAASSSKTKVGTKTAKPKFDPMKVEGEELDELMNLLIAGDRA